MTPRLTLLVELNSDHDPVEKTRGLRCREVEIVAMVEDGAVAADPPGIVTVAGGEGALDRAVEAASGHLVAVADPGGVIDTTRLDAVLDAVHGPGGTAVVYTDERVNGVDVLKPEWSPTYFHHLDYFGRLTILPRSLVRAAGGFGTADSATGIHRFLIHLAGAGVPMRHVPAIAYERNEAHLPLWAPATPSVPPIGTPVSVLLPTAGIRAGDGRHPDFLVLRAIDTICRAAAGMDVEIVCPVGPEADPEALAELESAGRGLVRVIEDPRAFNFSRRMNLAAVRSRGDVLVWMNDDVERHSDDDWLRTIVALALVPDIGGVGVKLLYPDDTVQTVGVCFDSGLPRHVGVGAAQEEEGPLASFVTPREQLAVTGALFATRASVYDEVGGLTEALPVNFGDVDYCMKVRSRGYRVVLTPRATLRHHESASRPPGVVAPGEFAELRRRWPVVQDPYWPWGSEFCVVTSGTATSSRNGARSHSPHRPDQWGPTPSLVVERTQARPRAEEG